MKTHTHTRMTVERYVMFLFCFLFCLIYFLVGDILMDYLSELSLFFSLLSLLTFLPLFWSWIYFSWWWWWCTINGSCFQFINFTIVFAAFYCHHHSVDVFISRKNNFCCCCLHSHRLLFYFFFNFLQSLNFQIFFLLGA